MSLVFDPELECANCHTVFTIHGTLEFNSFLRLACPICYTMLVIPPKETQNGERSKDTSK